MPGLDDQDQSEVFDEDNADISETGGVTSEYKTFEEQPEVLDVTWAAGDDGTEDRDLDEEAGSGGVEPEAGAGYDGEDSQASEGDPGSEAQSGGEVELVYAGLMEDVKGAQASAAHWEAGTLSDDDIEDLGYGPTGEDQ